MAANFQRVGSKIIMTQGRRRKMMFVMVRKENNNDPRKFFCGVVRYRQENTEVISHVTSRVRPKDAENGLQISKKATRHAKVQAFFFI